eukprot:5742563-Pleurochrysis_carterae.AAC.1
MAKVSSNTKPQVPQFRKQQRPRAAAKVATPTSRMPVARQRCAGTPLRSSWARELQSQSSWVLLNCCRETKASGGKSNCARE